MAAQVVFKSSYPEKVAFLESEWGGGEQPEKNIERTRFKKELEASGFLAEHVSVQIRPPDS